MSHSHEKPTLEELEHLLESAIQTAQHKFDLITEQIERGMRSSYPSPNHLHEEHGYRAGWLHALEAVLKEIRGQSDIDIAPERHDHL